MSKSPVGEILKSIYSQTSGVKSPIISIDGFSGAGKSTLASELCKADDKITLVHMDDFYRVVDERTALLWSPQEGYENYFDWERLQLEVLRPLSESRLDICFGVYDWMKKEISRKVSFHAKGPVIIEGVYSFRPELRGVINYSIFVDTPKDERVRRLEARHQNSLEWRTRWLAAEAFYEENFNPRESAKISVKGI